PAGRALAVLLHQRQHRLHERAVVLVRGGVRFVAADVQVRPRSQLGDLTDDVLDEAVGDVQVDAQRAVTDLGVGARRHRFAVAVQLAVDGQRGVGVTGHVDLRHDRDVPALGVGDPVGVVLLGQVTTADPAHAGAFATTFRRQPGPRVDLDAPALVVGQVQMQVVDLVVGDLVDVGLDLVRGVEVPGDVQHRVAAGEAWGVGYPVGRQGADP